MPLTAQQEQVLALISAGSSITAAAQTAGIHRNTIYNWLRSAPAFRLELAAAREANAVYWRDQAEQHAAAAIETIRALMTDSNAPASVRLKAALSILTLAITPPPTPSAAAPESPDSVHNSAQLPMEVPTPHQLLTSVARQTLGPVHNPAGPVHNSAQPDCRPGRNHPESPAA